ncbi:MAG: hypothetical protein IIA45_11060 [Bacteroidetes bacterium]|nr:hypothetical protein [Bacteroidota bacterium]
MDYYLIVLRLIHIFSGVFWAGALLMVTVFIFPTVKKLGPEGGKFMMTLSNTRKYPAMINMLAAISLLSGVMLMDKLSHHFEAWWFDVNANIVFTIGGAIGFLAIVYGSIMVRPIATKLGKIGAEIKASGAPPTPEQGKELGVLQKDMMSGITILTVMVSIVVICMSIAQYT